MASLMPRVLPPRPLHREAREVRGPFVRGAADGSRRAREEQEEEREQRREQREDNERAVRVAMAPLFASAVEVWGNGKRDPYAVRLGITKSVLSEMCSGDKPVSPRDYLPLREVPEAWAVFLDGMARLGGLSVCYRRTATVSAAQVKDWLLEEVLADESIREILLDRVSRRQDVDVEELEHALEIDAPEPEEGERTPAIHSPDAHP